MRSLTVDRLTHLLSGFNLIRAQEAGIRGVAGILTLLPTRGLPDSDVVVRAGDHPT